MSSSCAAAVSRRLLPGSSRFFSTSNNSIINVCDGKKLKVGLIGAGRIGKIHAQNLKAAGADIVMVVDIDETAAKKAFETYGTETWSTDVNALFDRADIQAVVICSPTHLHSSHMLSAASKGKHIFCEKPIDLDLNVVNALVPQIEASGVKCMLGFNRRFDSNAIRMKRAIESGEIGKLNLLRIASFDPSPPPIDYIKISGGMFCDMTIHDFDMARFLVNDQVDEVYAKGMCRDANIASAGDIDTAVVILTFKNGVIATIENSRLAVYGYDQRMEALGSEGGMKSENRFENQVTILNNNKSYTDLPMNFFLDRYMNAYVKEMTEFVAACCEEISSAEKTSSTKVEKVIGKQLVGIMDGQAALRIAEAANLSYAEKRAVKMSEIQ